MSQLFTSSGQSIAPSTSASVLPMNRSCKILLFMSKNVLPIFSSRSFRVSGLIFRTLNHFEFIFVYGVKEWSNFILLLIVVQFSQHHLLDTGFFSVVCYYLLCHRLMNHRCVGLFPDPLFCSTDLCVCFCARVIVF